MNITQIIKKTLAAVVLFTISLFVVLAGYILVKYFPMTFLFLTSTIAVVLCFFAAEWAWKQFF